MFKKQDKQLTAQQQHVKDVFRRVCLAYQLNNNAELERHLGLSTSFCTARINRASLPYEVIDQTCRKTGISFDQLLYGTPVKQIDGNDLLVIKNGLIKSLLELKGGGFINKADTPDDIENLAKIQAASIEHELNLHWTKNKKDSD